MENRSLKSFILLLLSSAALMAQPALVQVSDTVLNQNGSTFTGTAVIISTTGNPFSGTTVTINNGALNVLVYAAQSTQDDYIVTYTSFNSTQFSQTWHVAYSFYPVKLSQIVVGSSSMAISPDVLTFATSVGSNPAAQSITVTNTGAGTLTYSAAAGQSMTTLSAASGTAPGAITVTLNAASLPAGTYTDTITITPSVGAVQTVSVALVVASGGSGTTSVTFVDEVSLSGTINGTNQVFSLPSVPAFGSLKLYYNGLRQKLGYDYTLSGTTVTFINSVFPQTGSVLLADYRQ